MSSNGYWINNERVLWKNIIKPCKMCGFCPYGSLVEEFPLQLTISRSDALKHQEYMIDALSKGGFDVPECPNSPLMTREMAEREIAEFNAEDYPEIPLPANKMKCEVFGHDCPVYYHAELLSENNELTPDEIEAFEKEADEFLSKYEDGDTE